MATLADLIDEIDEWLEDANDVVEQSSGSPTEQQQAEVTGDLDSTQTNIDIIFDPNDEPSLRPPDAGTIDHSLSPTTLIEYAAVTHDLAKQAKIEVHEQSPNDVVIGTKLKTIIHLLPGYRVKLRESSLFF